MLAHTQSLMLYQIMRFFDGDIIARSSADATFSQLDTSTRFLSEYIDWGSSAACSDPQLAPDFWHDWIFQESARRTYRGEIFPPRLEASDGTSSGWL